MSGEDSPGLRFVEAHEMFIQHVEAGRARIRVLSLITIVVTFVLLATYFAQLLLPFTSGTRYLSLDLLSPSVVLLQVFLIAIIFAWLYIGIVDYIFASRLGAVISEGRALEKELEKKALASEPLVHRVPSSHSSRGETHASARDGKRTDHAGSAPAGGTGAQKERLILLPKDSDASSQEASRKRKESETESSGNRKSRKE